jgi:hypothetical protein
MNQQQMQAYVRKQDLNLVQFFFLNHLWAGLPTELRRVLNLQNQDKLKLSNAVKLATIEARSREEAKCSSKVYATTTLDDYEEAQIDAFQQGTSYNKQTSKRFQPQSPRKNNPPCQQSKSSWRSTGQGNNANHNGQTCIFSKMQNHHQEECRKQIKALMAVPSGQKSTWLTPTNWLRCRPWTSLSRIFNTGLDGTPTSSSPHDFSDNFESLCHLHCDIQ